MTAAPHIDSVGVAALDEDHRLLAEIGQVVARALRRHDRRMARVALEGLETLARAHFSREHDLMAACRFPQRLEHQDNHDIFLRELGQVGRALARARWDAAEGRLCQSLELLRARLLREDALYGLWLADKGLSAEFDGPVFAGFRKARR